MKHQIIINNYTLGARLRMTPIDKIVKQYRLDSRHTLVVYEDLTKSEIEFCERVFARKLKEREIDD